MHQSLDDCARVAWKSRSGRSDCCHDPCPDLSIPFSVVASITTVVTLAALCSACVAVVRVAILLVVKLAGAVVTRALVLVEVVHLGKVALLVAFLLPGTLEIF